VQARVGGVIQLKQVAQVLVVVGQRRENGVLKIGETRGQQSKSVELAQRG
jgi:hypothetical protein